MYLYNPQIHDTQDTFTIHVGSTLNIVRIQYIRGYVSRALLAAWMYLDPLDEFEIHVSHHVKSPNLNHARRQDTRANRTRNTTRSSTQPHAKCISDVSRMYLDYPCTDTCILHVSRATVSCISELRYVHVPLYRGYASLKFPTAPQGVPPTGRIACSLINLSLQDTFEIHV